VLTLVYVFSFIDRQILSLLVGPIRRDLGISDFEMSLLMGTTFALFYTFFGIPLGWLADSGSRRSLIAAGFALWSLFTAGCGLARSFTGMALARIGVGVGEASLSPAAYSLLTDYFPPRRRATALSVYGMGIYIGSGLAFLLGGVVIGVAGGQETYVLPFAGPVHTWQLVFFIVGLPGVLLALLLYTVREPYRRGPGAGSKIPIREVLAYGGRNKLTFFCHNFGFGFIALGTYATAAWMPAFMMRVYGWPASKAGIVYGTVTLAAGSLGIVAGGWCADRLRAKGYRDATMRVALYAVIAALPLAFPIYLSRNAAVMVTALAFAGFLLAAPFGVAPAAIQQVMPNRMRAQASSSYLFINNLVGLGLGPPAVALVSQRWFGSDASIGDALLVVGTAGRVIAIGLLALSLKPYLQSLDRLQAYLQARG
jgi:MFS family permease